MSRAQAAIEFMMTYGWAILIIMMAIGALAYFGVFKNTLPDKCNFNNNLYCQDAIIKSAFRDVNASIINGMGQTIYNVKAEPDNFVQTVGRCTPFTTPLTAAPNDRFYVHCGNISTATTLTSGSQVRLKIKITYTKTPVGGFNQVSLGEVYATVQ